MKVVWADLVAAVAQDWDMAVAWVWAGEWEAEGCGFDACDVEGGFLRDEVVQVDGEECPDGDARVEGVVAASTEVHEVLQLVQAVHVQEAGEFVFGELAVERQ